VSAPLRQRLALLLACCTLLACAGAGARESRKSPSKQTRAASAKAAEADAVTAAFASLNAIRKEADRQDTPLGAWTVYLAARERSTDPLRDFLTQTLAALEAELGLYDEALRDYPPGKPITIGDTAAFPEPQDYTAVSAVDAISELARDKRLVFVNEVHHDTHTRELTLALLPRLRALGYTHFAAEMLDEKDRDLTTRGYPVQASGYYSREPLAGEILRRALQLGFTVVPYESTQENAGRDAREREQAENLYHRVFEKSPGARLFVHAGYAHVHKAKGHLWDTAPLAMQLGARLGIAPLCIDQTLLRPNRSESEYDAYPLLIDTYAPREPIVLRARKDAHAWSLEPGFYDVSVVLPRSEAVDGRPGWLDLHGARRRTPVDDGFCGDTRPCLIEARRAAENNDAVPVDRWLRLAGSPMAPLYLFPGRYHLRASDAHGKLLGERDLAVPDATAP
jgi:hypothetical protein